MTLRNAFFKAQVYGAIGAHRRWRTRLLTAVALEASDITVDRARRDDECQFGQWLDSIHGVHRNLQFHLVKSAHARFHAEAGRILALALEGCPQEACAAVRPGTVFDRISTRLIQELERWAGSA